MQLPTEPYELQIIHWSNERPDQELCGVLLRHYDSFLAVQIANVAREPRFTFAMEEKPFLDAVNSGNVWGVWHVHPGPNDEDGPSLADRHRANAWGLPGCILIRRTMRFRYYMPDGYKVPLVGRPYVPGVFDCFALVKDALEEFLGFEHEDLDREKLEHDGCLPGIKEYWESQGWEMLFQPKVGRLAMINFNGNARCNHLGLVMSNYDLLHQLRGRPSSVDYLGSWQKWVLGYLAHPTIEQKIKALGWTRLPYNPLDTAQPESHEKPPRRPQGAFSRAGNINTAARPLDRQILKMLRK